MRIPGKYYRNSRPARTLLMLLFPLLLLACNSEKPAPYAPEYSPEPVNNEQVYILGLPPLHNPLRVEQVYRPIFEYLSRQLPDAEIRLEMSRSYEDFDKKLYGRYFHFAIPNPYQAINSLKRGYLVFGKMGNDEAYKGVILVRKDSGINKVPDLRGKTICFPSPSAFAGMMIPVYFLHTRGLDAGKDYKRLFSGSQESAVMNVYLRKSAAAGNRLSAWKTFQAYHPDIAAQLEVKWEAPALVSIPLVARDDVPAALRLEVGRVLFSMDKSPEGRNLLKPLMMKLFEPATEETYKPVFDFLEAYKKAFPETNHEH